MRNSWLQAIIMLLCCPIISIANASVTEIDLMVVYTQKSATNFGDTQKIEQAINYAVINTNTIYRNSGIFQRLRLVHTRLVDFQEDKFRNKDSDEVVNALQQKEDGYLDDVLDLRNRYGADLIMLIADGESWANWTGGDARVLYKNDGSLSETEIFSVVDWRYLQTGTAFPHELGHTMGLQHDWYVSATKTVPYPYAHGYVNLTAGWRTIMAYDKSCEAAGKECPRIPFFSNPDLSWQGQPTGVAEGTNTSCQKGIYSSDPPCDADARKTLNNTAATVAAFRQPTVQNLSVPEPLDPQGTVQTWQPTFSWNAVADATKYRLLIGIAPENGTRESLQDGKKILHYQWYDANEICQNNICRVTPAVNFSNGRYYWTVQPHNDTAFARWSEVTDFVVFSTEAKPIPDVLPLVPDGKIKVSQRPMFYWQPIVAQAGNIRASHYRILVWSRDRNETIYSSPWYEAGTICDQTICSVPSLERLEPGNYLWRVKAKNASGKGQYKHRAYFQVKTGYCESNRNEVLAMDPYFLLYLPNFCIGQNYYSGNVNILFNTNQQWKFVGDPALSPTSDSCYGNSNLVNVTSDHITLDISGFCLGNEYVPFASKIYLGLDGSWYLE